MISYGCHDLNEAQAEAPLGPVNAVKMAGLSKGTANQAIVKALAASKNWFQMAAQSNMPRQTLNCICLVVCCEPWRSW